jgi:hypothetical protein
MRRRTFITLLGGASAWPLAARSQQPAMPAVGFLGVARGPLRAQLAALHRALNEAGYVDGQNVQIEYRWAEGSYDRMFALAADLAARPVSVLLATGGDPARWRQRPLLLSFPSYSLPAPIRSSSASLPAFPVRAAMPQACTSFRPCLKRSVSACCANSCLRPQRLRCL